MSTAGIPMPDATNTNNNARGRAPSGRKEPGVKEFDDGGGSASGGFAPEAGAQAGEAPAKQPHAMDYALADAVLAVAGDGREAIARALHLARRLREAELRACLKKFGGDNDRLRYQLIRQGNAHVREIRNHRRKIDDCDRLKALLVANTGMDRIAVNAILRERDGVSLTSASEEATP